ncbi:MAG: tripartite tricarboxylate transporter substrate binding protein [Synergistaceae bacterium]|nr:tripartite tricarboxylate transporter substrate binding protein [Synergistota bacterium]NLM70331.1 tripartite tricarboxylate transporter substrate binding protein [Synergistaceae bacterium]
MKRVLLLALALILAFGAAAAADYPTKPVTIIVASNAGGGTDTMARLFAKFAEKYFPQPFVINNIDGAGGQRGFDALARAKKDGYTIGTVYTPHFTAHISANRANYTIDDFDMLYNLVTDPGVLIVPSSSPFKTVEDIIEAEKAAPGALTGSTSGPGSDDAFALAQFNESTGCTVKSVPATGSSNAKATVMGGHVSMGFMNLSQIESNYRAGELRILAMMTHKRHPNVPEIPTFAELGYKVISDSSRGFAAPAGFPEDAYKMILEVFEKVLVDPDFLDAAKEQLETNFLGPDEYKAYLEDLLEVTNRAYEKDPW